MNKRILKQSRVVILGVALFAGTATAAETEEKKTIKDSTVKILMNFAFSLMPQVYTGPDGKKITIDKKNPKEVTIPVDDARRIIIVGVRSANAQKCDLKVMQTLNHNAMVKYETVFRNWTSKQKLFINQLHLFTVLYMTGNVKINEGENDGKPKPPKEAKYNCSDDEKTQVQKSIDTYLEQVKAEIANELKRRSKLGSNEKKNNEVIKAEK